MREWELQMQEFFLNLFEQQQENHSSADSTKRLLFEC